MRDPDSGACTRSKMVSVWRSVIAAVSLLVVVGCKGTGEGPECCFIDVTSHVIIQGTTIEADGSPVGGTAVAPLGRIAYECTTKTDSFGADPPVALSDADGFFQLRLATSFSVGLYCLDFTAIHPDGILVDTLRNVEANFRLLAETPDTVFLQVLFGG